MWLDLIQHVLLYQRKICLREKSVCVFFISNFISLDKAFFLNQKVLIFFLLLPKNICFGYSLEVPCQYLSNEYPGHIFSWRNKKNINLIWYLLLSRAVWLEAMPESFYVDVMFIIISSPGALPWRVVRRLSVVCPSVRPSLTFHVFDISSWAVSQIEVKLSGRHCGNMEIQNC